MSIRRAEVLILSGKELSGDILDEILPDNILWKQGVLFWAYAPNKISELENAPNWSDYCRKEDIKPGQKVLIE